MTDEQAGCGPIGLAALITGTWLMTPIAGGHGVGIYALIIIFSSHFPWMKASFVVSSACFVASIFRRDARQKLTLFRLGILALATSVLINGALLEDHATYAITSLPFAGVAVFALWSSSAWRGDGSRSSAP